MTITDEQKEAYKKYITSQEWYDLKIYLLGVRGIKCEKCGAVKNDARKVHIHHLTYVRLFDELPSDLIILCPVCHMKEHGLIKEKKVRVKSIVKPPKNKADALLSKIARRYKEGYYKTYDSYLSAKKAAKKKLVK